MLLLVDVNGFRLFFVAPPQWPSSNVPIKFDRKCSLSSGPPAENCALSPPMLHPQYIPVLFSCLPSTSMISQHGQSGNKHPRAKTELVIFGRARVPVPAQTRLGPRTHRPAKIIPKSPGAMTQLDLSWLQGHPENNDASDLFLLQVAKSKTTLRLFKDFSPPRPLCCRVKQASHQRRRFSLISLLQKTTQKGHACLTSTERFQVNQAQASYSFTAVPPKGRNNKYKKQPTPPRVTGTPANPRTPSDTNPIGGAPPSSPPPDLA